MRSVRPIWRSDFGERRASAHRPGTPSPALTPGALLASEQVTPAHVDDETTGERAPSEEHAVTHLSPIDEAELDAGFDVAHAHEGRHEDAPRKLAARRAHAAAA